MVHMQTGKYFKFIVFCAAFIFSAVKMAAVPYAVFNHKIFYVPEKGPVIETYFDIYGKSITLLQLTEEEDAFQGEVELTVIFKVQDQIITYDKKSLKSPVMSQGNIVDFIDVQRFAVPPGDYMVEIELKDLNAPVAESSTKAEVAITIPEVPEDTFFSDLELISALKPTDQHGPLSKSGYDLLPMVSDSIIKPAMSELVMYTELYNTDQRFKNEEMFLITSYLEDSEKGEAVESTRKYLRKSPKAVLPILMKMPLDEISQGAYKIVIEARTRENFLFAKVEHSIQRDKQESVDVLSMLEDEDIDATWVSKFDTKASIFDYIHSLRPVATAQEKAMLSNSFREFEKSELIYLRRFMYAFWESRNPGDGESEWMKYKTQVDFVNEEFGTINKEGFETDRGRVYLQYGPPNDLTDRANEPSSYPYQIWRYYKTGQFNNVRFVFYDPTLMNVDYELLHTEGIRGEIINPQWRLLLEQRNTPMNNVDAEQGRQHFGGRVDDFFENPR